MQGVWLITHVILSKDRFGLVALGGLLLMNADGLHTLKLLSESKKQDMPGACHKVYMNLTLAPITHLQCPLQTWVLSTRIPHHSTVGHCFEYALSGVTRHSAGMQVSNQAAQGSVAECLALESDSNQGGKIGENTQFSKRGNMKWMPVLIKRLKVIERGLPESAFFFAGLLVSVKILRGYM